MMVVLVIMGVCGSGKTAVGKLLAAKVGCDFADADDFHPERNVALMRSGTPLTDEDRRPWLESLHVLIEDWERNPSHTPAWKRGVTSISAPDEAMLALRTFGSIDQKAPGCLETSLQKVKGVLACSALRRTYRDILICGTSDEPHNGENPGGSPSVPVVFVALCGDKETILFRLESRTGHYMPPSLLQSQLETLEIPTKEEGKGCIVIRDLSRPVEELVGTITHKLPQLLHHL